PLPPLPVVERKAETGAKCAPLIQAMREGTLEARDKAAAELLAMGTAALPYLQDAAKEGDDEIKARVAAIIRRLQRPIGTTDLEATALAALTFIGAGYTHMSPDTWDKICFGDVVKSSVRWLVERQDKEGRIG